MNLADLKKITSNRDICPGCGNKTISYHCNKCSLDYFTSKIFSNSEYECGIQITTGRYVLHWCLIDLGISFIIAKRTIKGDKPATTKIVVESTSDTAPDITISLEEIEKLVILS